MSFGKILRQLRVKAGYSQEELAEKIFLSRSAVSRLENDNLELKLADAIRWFQATRAPEAVAAMLCGVDINTLLQALSILAGGIIAWF
ncbi:helix-turn-helix domain-containing protein [Sutcliffiella horikoshii]|uniref:helix-turn-helix transcriptional regulator n=1 Tax=Sutcliffiella horikoshii TaxID=79883 RepID=UPI0007D077DD|nr:helix-turn-helix transcriptional regulator [Sutcliffiella horikoshii]MCM3620472.1 helix-turn-helix domain-containing protein [Sutcliffiella horikoshii]